MTDPVAPRSRFVGLMVGIAVAAYVGLLANSYRPLSSTELGTAVGFALGVLLAIPIVWDRSAGRGAASALLCAMVATAYARRLGPELSMASSAQREAPTLVRDGDAAWIVHPLGIEVRVSPQASLVDDERALRASRYASMPPEMTASSWADRDTGVVRLDLLAVRVSRIDDAFCAAASRGAEASLRSNGATIERATGETPCDRTFHGTVVGQAFASRLVVVGDGADRVWATVSAIGDGAAVESVPASVRASTR